MDTNSEKWPGVGPFFAKERGKLDVDKVWEQFFYEDNFCDVGSYFRAAGPTYFGLEGYSSTIDRVIAPKQQLHNFTGVCVAWRSGRRLQLIPSKDCRDHYPLLAFFRYKLEFPVTSNPGDERIFWDYNRLNTCLQTGKYRHEFLAEMTQVLQSKVAHLEELSEQRVCDQHWWELIFQCGDIHLLALLLLLIFFVLIGGLNKSFLKTSDFLVLSMVGLFQFCNDNLNETFGEEISTNLNFPLQMPNSSIIPHMENQPMNPHSQPTLRNTQPPYPYQVHVQNTQPIMNAVPSYQNVQPTPPLVPIVYPTHSGLQPSHPQVLHMNLMPNQHQMNLQQTQMINNNQPLAQNIMTMEQVEQIILEQMKSSRISSVKEDSKQENIVLPVYGGTLTVEKEKKHRVHLEKIHRPSQSERKMEKFKGKSDVKKLESMFFQKGETGRKGGQNFFFHKEVFISNWEKELIAKIQISQLVSDNPMKDDFYFEIYSGLSKKQDHENLKDKDRKNRKKSLPMNKIQQQMQRLIERRKSKLKEVKESGNYLLSNYSAV